MSTSTAHIEVVVDSSGVRLLDKELKQLNATAKDTEQQQQRLTAAASAAEKQYEREFTALVNAEAKKANAYERDFAALVKAEDKKEALAKRAYERDFALLVKQTETTEKAAKREADAWNDAKQKALAAADKKAEAAEKSAARRMAADENAAKRENELWNNAIQRAKAGLDGVLPIRPRLEAMLQGVQQQLSTKSAQPTNASGASASAVGAFAENPLSALGTSVAGYLPQIAAATASLAGLRKVVAETSAYDALIARLAGVAEGTEAARKQFDKLEELSDKTIFTENAVTEAFIRMEQNGIKPTEQTLLAYANIASATGNSIEQLSEASLSASMGNYRGLRQFGIKAEEEGGRLKVTFKGVSTTIGTSSAEIVKYLVGIGENDFAGAAERQLDTMGGAVKKVEDAWGDLFREVGRSAVGEFIATGMKEAANAINVATAAFEALLYTASQRPKFTGMSADLAGFTKGAAKWGAPKSDEELSLEDRTQAAIDHLNKGLLSANDKALAEYRDRENTLKDALVAGLGGDIGAALDENKRQYEAVVNSANKPNKEKEPKTNAGEDFFRKLEIDNQLAFDARVKAAAEAGAQEYEAIKAALTKQEDAVKASYAKQKAWLSDYTGTDAAELLAANEVLWDKHLAEVRAKQEKEQLELQKRLRNIGIGPQTKTQAVQSKYDGQYAELGAALSDNLSGKNGASLQLAAEQTYKQKSVAIERARARELAQIDRELVQQSLTSAQAMFGNFASAAKNMGGEQSDVYKEMFAVQQAFAIASATMSMATGMGKAIELGWPAGIPQAIEAASEGAKVLSMISSAQFSGAYDNGGYIPAGSAGIVGDRGPELVNGPARVTSRVDTASLLGQNRGGNTTRLSMNIGFDTHNAFNQYLSSTRGTQTLNTHIKRNGSFIRSVTG